MKRFKVRKILKSKVFMGAMAVFIAVGIFNLGRLSAYFSGSELDEVLAYVDSNATDQEKITMLEKRYNNEVASLNTLMTHSDLCSSVYINELSTIEMQMEATIKGYEKLFEKKDMDKYPTISEKSDDYVKVEKALENLNVNITKTNYEDAITEVETLEQLLSKEYLKINNELTKFGN